MLAAALRRHSVTAGIAKKAGRFFAYLARHDNSHAQRRHDELAGCRYAPGISEYYATDSRFTPAATCDADRRSGYTRLATADFTFHVSRQNLFA